MANTFKERRRAERVNKRISLKITSDEFDLFSETKNISTNGIYCESVRFIPLMSKVNVMLFVPAPGEHGTKHKQIMCQGTVVRTEVVREKSSLSKYNIAVFFNTIDRHARDILADYLKNNHATDCSSTPHQ